MRQPGVGRIVGAGWGRLRAAALAPLCMLLALGACTADQSGVRDWSIQAREAVLPPGVSRAAPTDAAPVAAPDRAEAVLVLRETAAAWLAVLAALADDATPPDDSAALEARAARIAAIDPAASAAAVNLARATGHVARRNWGASHLAYAVDYGDPFFQAVVAALGTQPVAARIGAGHALLMQRRSILGQADTGRMMRAEASELRRLMVVRAPTEAPAR